MKSSPFVALALTTLVAGCHDFSALSSHYNASPDFGCDASSSCADLGHEPDFGPAGGDEDGGVDMAVPSGDMATPIDLLPPPVIDLLPPPPIDMTVVGHLSGSGAATAALIDLSALGTIDWAHYGYPSTVSGAGNYDHKAGVTAQIGYYTTLTNFVAAPYANNVVGYSWSDGTTTPSVTNTTTGVFRAGAGDGFSFTVPASTQPRTLSVFVGGYRSNGKLTASLSDGSAENYSDASFSRSDGNLYDAVYTLNFNAAHSGATLTVIWSAVTVIMDGNVTLQAAALR